MKPTFGLEPLEERRLLSMTLTASGSFSGAGQTTDAAIALDGILLSAQSSTPNGFDHLWRSDGTPEGTVLLSSVNISPEFARLNGRIYFPADDGIHGWELWSTDGTAEGTRLAVDVVPGGSSRPTRLTSINGRLWFSAFPADSGMDRLATSDGTPEGTHFINSVTNPEQFFALDGKSYVIDAAPRIWKTDGTLAGTALVANFNEGQDSAYVTSLAQPTSFKNKVIFFQRRSPDDSHPYQLSLWEMTDPQDGPHKITDLPSGSQTPESLVQLGKLWFTVYNGGDEQLWTSDGTAKGTQLVQTFSGSELGGRLLPAPGGVYVPITHYTPQETFTALELWQSDGTPEGTFPADSLDGQFDSSADVSEITLDGQFMVAASDRQRTRRFYSIPATASKLLHIRTGAADDTVKVSMSGGKWKVTVDRKTHLYNPRLFSAVAISTGAGNDRIAVANSVPVASIDAGAGNDLVVGGNGGARFGGAGRDLLITDNAGAILLGGGGNDTLIGSNGSDHSYKLRDRDHLYLTSLPADPIFTKPATLVSLSQAPSVLFKQNVRAKLLT